MSLHSNSRKSSLHQKVTTYFTDVLNIAVAPLSGMNEIIRKLVMCPRKCFNFIQFLFGHVLSGSPSKLGKTLHVSAPVRIGKNEE